MLSFNSPVTELSGCGKLRAEKLKALGIETVRDLLYHFPRGYQNRGDVKSIKEAPLKENASFVLTVITPAVAVRLRGGKVMTKCKCTDGETSCTLIFFNQAYVKDVLHKDCTYRFWGKLTIGKSGYQLSPSSIEPVTEGRFLRKFVPVYPLSAGLSSNIISSMVTTALSALSDEQIPDILSLGLRETLGVCETAKAMRMLHQPKSTDDISVGRNRFTAEELFVFSCAVSAVRSGRQSVKAIKMDKEKSRLTELLEVLPFTLTEAQSKVIREIRNDMTENNYPMARLISGDVGSGKTVCAAAAAYIAVKNGCQCALMTPTEILASQHFGDLQKMFEPLGVKTACLTGSMTASQKRNIYAKLESGEINLIIGTHALLSEGVRFSRLGLVITDEQHRFGVMQRALLTQKGESPHVLVMSATPIPRTLALILCKDLDISVIDQLPPGRQKVDTLLVGEKHRSRMNGFISEQVKAGRQVYIVCPTVESKEEREEENAGEVLYFDFRDSERESLPELKSAVDYEKDLRENVFPHFKTAFLHGRMSGKEKTRIMTEFSRGEIDILVSTTVIEVGVNVPNATLMIVENAERFGMSQLHQLRGRVGRGSEKSYCILVSDAKGEKARKRLEVMKNTSDGYTIAKYDLEMRGPGDFVSLSGQSARQHGEMGFKIAGLCTDTELLNKCFDAANELYRLDPELSLPEHALLKETIGTAQSDRASIVS